MGGGLRGDVIECHNILISKNNIGRNFSLNDFAKQTCGI
jgi:hypothetical protein